MADHRWDYPAVAGATSSLVFVKGARFSGDPQSLSLNQDTGKTLGSVRWAKNYGAASHLWQFSVAFYAAHASDIDLADVLSWIETVSVGAVNSFVWSDSAGVQRTVRIIDAEFSFPEFGHDTQSCIFTLEKQ
jgi:hypothetical protein